MHNIIVGWAGTIGMESVEPVIIDNRKKRILSVSFVREPEALPDLSHFGEYSDVPGDDDKTIDRQERGDQWRNEHRYFIAALSGENTGNPESVEQDYQR